MSNFLCILRGPPSNLICPCCEHIQPGEDSFVSHLCWPCGMGENAECVRCVERGVPFNLFGGMPSRTKMHRLRQPMGDWATAVCGYTVARSDVGCGTAVFFRYCKHCWPDDDDDEARET